MSVCVHAVCVCMCVHVCTTSVCAHMCVGMHVCLKREDKGEAAEHQKT